MGVYLHVKRSTRFKSSNKLASAESRFFSLSLLSLLFFFSFFVKNFADLGFSLSFWNDE